MTISTKSTKVKKKQRNKQRKTTKAMSQVLNMARVNSSTQRINNLYKLITESFTFFVKNDLLLFFGVCLYVTDMKLKLMTYLLTMGQIPGISLAIFTAGQDVVKCSRQRQQETGIC